MKPSAYKVLHDHGIATLVEGASGEKSLLSNQQFNAGDCISPFYARETLKEPTYLTLQLNDHEHILLGPTFLQYINHSCDPNSFFDTTEMKLIALKEILPNEEINFFYPSTEWEMDQVFLCKCGTPHCLKKIEGAFRLTKKQQDSYKLNNFIIHKIQQTG